MVKTEKYRMILYDNSVGVLVLAIYRKENVNASPESENYHETFMLLDLFVNGYD